MRAGLDRLGIAYRASPRLVRGLDYYCHTAFEFVTTELGAQGTVLGGGRYDGLMGVMGGPETPGVGWAAGIERLALLIGEPPPRAAADRHHAGRRARAKRRRSSSPMRCAATASPSNSAIPAISRDA